MKHRVNQTFSLPEELVDELHRYIKSMERSAFVAEMIRLGIENKKNALKNEFIEMGQDTEQQESMRDWETTVGDGIIEE